MKERATTRWSGGLWGRDVMPVLRRRPEILFHQASEGGLLPNGVGVVPRVEVPEAEDCAQALGALDEKFDTELLSALSVKL